METKDEIVGVDNEGPENEVRTYMGWKTQDRRMMEQSFTDKTRKHSESTNLMLNICAKFHEYRTCSFREITRASPTNERTNQPTNSSDHSVLWRR